MRGRVPKHFEPVRILHRPNADCRIALNPERGIDELAVNAPRKSRLREPRPNARSDLGDRDRRVELLLFSVGKRDYRHRKRSLPDQGRIVRASGIEPLTPTMSR